MTWTALTEAEEFEKIYNIDTVTIPTNKPILRVDKSDKVYFNQKAKWKAVWDMIGFYHEIWVPMLIGTSSIQTSEYVSTILNKANLPHFVLNAKFHEQEANIVKNAGKSWSIVVATNMAWRGTDIKLNPDMNGELAFSYAKRAKRKLNATDAKHVSYVVYSEHEFELLSDALIETFEITSGDYESAYKKEYTHEHLKIRIILNKKKKKAEDPFAEIILKSVHQPSVDMVEKEVHVWLMIIGTEKHDSRRIDNQLRWRSGRQGDPGMSVFFVALDDEIMRKMGGDKIQSVAKLMMPLEELEKIAFTQKQFTNSIARAQKQMEGRHYGIRKHLFEYDSVINKQRQNVYLKRDIILSPYDEESQDNKEAIIDEIKTFVPELVQEWVSLYAQYSPRNTAELAESIQQVTWLQPDQSAIDSYSSSKKLTKYLTEYLSQAYESKIEQGEDVDAVVSQIKKIYLSVIDKNWMEHIDEMSYLREKVSLWSYAQQDPLIIYKREAYSKYQSLLSSFRKETLGYVMRARFAAPVAPTVANADMAAATQTVIDQLTWDDDSVDLMWMLQKVVWNIDPNDIPAPIEDKKWEEIIMKDGTRAHKVSSDDEFEVLELDDEDIAGSTNTKNTSVDDEVEVVHAVSKKLRPNDKVNIKYKDGKIGMDVKWKKVKELVENGEAQIITG